MMRSEATASSASRNPSERGIADCREREISALVLRVFYATIRINGAIPIP